ncbi:MAG: acylphosphatase [Gemmatimonadota bacterium]
MEDLPDRTKAERAAFLVQGRVQGVGFRWWTLHAARTLGLRGTARNRPDGSVEVHVEGSPEAVARFAELLAAGPRLARVDALTRISPSDRLPPDFRIIG